MRRPRRHGDAGGCGVWPAIKFRHFTPPTTSAELLQWYEMLGALMAGCAPPLVLMQFRLGQQGKPGGLLLRCLLLILALEADLSTESA